MHCILALLLTVCIKHQLLTPQAQVARFSRLAVYCVLMCYVRHRSSLRYCFPGDADTVFCIMCCVHVCFFHVHLCFFHVHPATLVSN